MRVGIGYDVHRLVANRKLILGGVAIPYELGLLGHSDADALTHAICDALLGAAGLRDIGQHFPDHDPRYKGAKSTELLKITHDLVREHHYQVVNIDATIIAQEPKLAPHLINMRESLSQTIDLHIDDISIKAKTNEKMDAVGQGEGMVCHVVLLLKKT